MSRGPGRWQRYWLQRASELSETVVAIIHDDVQAMLGRPPTRSELVAARRAAWQLSKTGRIRLVYIGQCQACEQLSNSLYCPACFRRCRRILAITVNPDVGFS